MVENDVIVALASGALPSGVAVVRLSGPGCIGVAEELVVNLPQPRVLGLRRFSDPRSGLLLDEGLLAVFPGPKSFTGEDCVEFQLHGSKAIISALLAVLVEVYKIRLAEAGEFTRRAFENGRLDLTAVEGLGDLLDAETEAQRVQALARSGGALQGKSDSWRQLLLDCLMELEADLDFSDEDDVPASVSESVRERLSTLMVDLSATLETYEGGRLVREGFRIGLVGAPNAGKSSLFNRLAKSELAIVTEEAGTTRDLNEVQIDFDGQLLTLIDSAGIREAAGLAEQEGIARARRLVAQSDLVLLVQAPDISNIDVGELGVDRESLIIVGNKCDLAEVPNVDVSVSRDSDGGYQRLRSVIGSKVMAQTVQSEPLVLSHRRDREAARECLTYVRGALLKNLEGELVCAELYRAVGALERWIGVVDSDAVLDRVFAGFCIGK